MQKQREVQLSVPLIPEYSPLGTLQVQTIENFSQVTQSSQIINPAPCCHPAPSFLVNQGLTPPC
jgi:hypothetical protein